MCLQTPASVSYTHLKEIAKKELSNKRLFVVDAFCGDVYKRQRQTSKKVKEAMRTRFANGAHYGAYAPLGYVKDRIRKVIFWLTRKQGGLSKRFLTLPFMAGEPPALHGFWSKKKYLLPAG